MRPDEPADEGMRWKFNDGYGWHQVPLDEPDVSHLHEATTLEEDA